MKTIIFFLLLICTSCNIAVRFNESQPKNGERQHVFPKKLHGKWTAATGETCTINDSIFEIMSLGYDDMENQTYTSFDTLTLSDSVQLLALGNYYVYNFLEENGTFTVAVVECDKNGDFNHYFADDPFQYSKVRSLTIDSASVLWDDYDEVSDEFIQHDSVLYQPNFQDLRQSEVAILNWVEFSGQMNKRDLRKLCVAENLVFSLRKDGSLYLPLEEE
ncbi:MAG: hypothetical protein ACFHU9_12480 [Fluviicola sp.]